MKESHGLLDPVERAAAKACRLEARRSSTLAKHLPMTGALRVLFDHLVVGQVDALIGNEEDLQKGLGIAGPEVAPRSKLDPETFFQMIGRVVEQFPNVQLVATTLREVHSTNRHDWAAVLWLDGGRFVSPTCHLDVHDRIGGGDGFASGLIYGLVSGRPAEEALRLGWAHGALLTTYPGDVTMAKLEEVEADMIRLAVHRYRGQMSEVARKLGIGRSTLYRKMKDLGLEEAIG